MWEGQTFKIQLIRKNWARVPISYSNLKFLVAIPKKVGPVHISESKARGVKPHWEMNPFKRKIADYRIGLPGSGKTTLAKKLPEELKLRVFRIGDYRSRVPLSPIGEAVFHPFPCNAF